MYICKPQNYLILISFTLLFAKCNADVNKAYDFLNETMDQYHQQFYVYSDHDSGGNHFFPTGKMGDAESCVIETDYNVNCYSGTACIKVSFTRANDNWSAVYWQHPENNWGTISNAGYDLTGATKITFWARGQNGGERVKFFSGGITEGAYIDSYDQVKTSWLSLSKQWKKYTINLSGKDLSYVIGGFGFETNAEKNPQGAVFYLDDIQFNKTYLDKPRFLVSYEAIANEETDKANKNVCFVYDNALAILAFLAKGTNDDKCRAKLIADSLIYAQNNDRFYNDGRLRNAYMSGDLSTPGDNTVRLPGFWDPVKEIWLEDEFCVSSHTGNITWAMIALSAYYRGCGGEQYLASIISLGDWVIDHTRDDIGIGGFTGGYSGWKENSHKLTYKSTEHNIDCYVAFMLLFEITGDTKWKDNALHAKRFVQAMWNEQEHFFWTGTALDGQTINYGNIPLDVQAWAVMALGLEKESVFWAEQNCYVESDGFKGFDFNNDKDGVWFEGTAQMCVAFQILKQMQKSSLFLEQIGRAQSLANNANGKGIVAASREGVSTGFEWEYFCRNHVGATAWYIFAEQEYNPYWNTGTQGQSDICDYIKDGVVDISDFAYLSSKWNNDLIPFGRDDIFEDGVIDVLDLIVFVNQWLEE